MIDTHSHLQFKVFKGQEDKVIARAKEAGVQKIIVVGTNVETSRSAVRLSESYNEVFAVVGIHPHHVFEHTHNADKIAEDIQEIEKLLASEKVVAVGEIGMDRHDYPDTKYDDYKIDDKFIKTQRDFFKAQIKLAGKYRKSLVLHNRESVTEFLGVLEENWMEEFNGKAVFHYCEPNARLLNFALKHNIFIGVDGDITYDLKKQEFIKGIPLENLVLETDSPFVIPEPLKSEGVTINEPKNLKFIAEFIAKLKNESPENVQKMSRMNSTSLFRI